ncbi:MAG TPA: TlyA family rRNA (cytidine-2'-O)-methyltransferase [Nitrospiraceae bacterium]|nr:TlyA family rRNA (cytidine-2'-O)-methyltransferase [Nitrospiraceae bacterium]
MKDRLDKIMVDRALVKSRERARALIMEGKVLVDGSPVTKAGAMINTDSSITLKSGDIPYVSRGGLKLKAAIDFFSIDLKDKTAMDIGSSTGGFTDCMLQMGAKKVYCIDVGYGQIAWPLRNDPRVILLERTNIRHLERKRIPDIIDIATIDVSFISLTKVIPKVLEFLKEDGQILALVKPQFEVGKGEVGKGGIVREEEKRLAAVDFVRTEIEAAGLHTIGLFESPVRGQKGNIEYFLYLKKG